VAALADVACAEFAKGAEGRKGRVDRRRSKVEGSARGDLCGRGVRGGFEGGKLRGAFAASA